MACIATLHGKWHVICQAWYHVYGDTMRYSGETEESAYQLVLTRIFSFAVPNEITFIFNVTWIHQSIYNKQNSETVGTLHDNLHWTNEITIASDNLYITSLINRPCWTSIKPSAMWEQRYTWVAISWFINSRWMVHRHTRHTIWRIYIMH